MILHLTNNKQQNKTKEKAKTELLERVFKLIQKPYFKDHKLGKDYCSDISFPRGLGEDVGNCIQSCKPEVYHKIRKDQE